MNIAMQKVIADKVLSKLELLDPSCILAGGAPRDWFFGVMAKDLDIFLYFRNDLPLKSCQKTIETILGQQITKCGNADSLNYKLNPNIRNVYETEIDGMQVQLILCTEPTFNIVDTFAFNICKIWYKKTKLRTTKAFTFSVENKVIIKTGELYACTEEYKQRILKKFACFRYFDSREAFFDYFKISL